MTDEIHNPKELNDELIRLRQEVSGLGNALDLERRRCAGRIEQADASARESREREERFKRLVQNSNDIIGIMDDKGVLFEICGPLEKVVGYKPEELIGTSGFSKVHPDNLDSAARAFNEVLAQPGSSRIEEYRYRHKNGSWVDMETVGINLLHDPVVKGVVLNIRDISERKILQARLQQTTKMEAIGVLAGGIAHDFNNLLNVINGYCELMLCDLTAEDPLRGDLEQIGLAGERAASLTSQLLAFSRKQILQPVILNLNEIVLDLQSMFRRLIRENIDLTAISQPDLGPIHADPGQIQQILMNLVANARDAIAEAGAITIETANADLDDECVREFPAFKAGPYIMLAVSDNGQGMDAATKAHLFEPFFTTKGKGKGTGLGLSTVYGIVSQSNGFLSVQSEPGRGTTFKIYFPRAAGEASKAPIESRITRGIVGTETVLVAEDEPSVRGLTTRVLREGGYTVLEAANGIAALDIARNIAGQIHLVLTDVVMPGMSGRELVSRLESERPGIKSLYVSGYTDAAIVHQGLLDSDVAFLQKPFTIEKLIRKVREVIG